MTWGSLRETAACEVHETGVHARLNRCSTSVLSIAHSRKSQASPEIAVAAVQQVRRTAAPAGMSRRQLDYYYIVAAGRQPGNLAAAVSRTPVAAHRTQSANLHKLAEVRIPAAAGRRRPAAVLAFGRHRVPRPDSHTADLPPPAAARKQRM